MEANEQKQIFLASYMKLCVLVTKDNYTCNRPPGPSGAIIMPNDVNELLILGCVKPNDHLPTCKNVGCDIVDGHCVRAIHAEQDAIFRAARDGIQLKGAWIFSTLKPCYHCTQAIVASGITKIFYAGVAYDDERTKEVLEANNVECIFIDIGLGYGQPKIRV